MQIFGELDGSGWFIESYHANQWCVHERLPINVIKQASNFD